MVFGEAFEYFYQKLKIGKIKRALYKICMGNLANKIGTTTQYHHLFFHSLVVYPQLAFRDNLDSKHDFETWMITVDEFKNLLESLYERNYCLVRMSDLLEDNSERLKADFKKSGKVPLVFSFDDVNYYEYMNGYGFAKNIVFTYDGELANTLVTPNGEEIISKEADGPAILEQFIKKHPDFTYRGARGILAVTGYEGLLGYHDLVKDREKILEIVAKLKKLGWEFACHSFHHKSQVFKFDLDEAKAIEDTEKWLKLIKPFLKETNICISPFGVPVQNYPKFYYFLKKVGFKYFCDVDNSRKFVKDRNAYFFPRVNIDGYLFRHRNYELETYYGKLNKIISKERLGEYSLYTNNSDSLAKHAYVCLKYPTVYVWGGIGEYITEELISNLRKQYPKVYTTSKCNELRKLIGSGIRGFDCSGLIKNYLMGGLPNFKYDEKLDWNSKMLIEKSNLKGSIETLPEKAGVCLYMEGHVGIYVGNGYVIESTSNNKFGNGVVKTKITDREWLQWFYCPMISYELKAN